MHTTYQTFITRIKGNQTKTYKIGTVVRQTVALRMGRDAAKHQKDGPVKVTVYKDGLPYLSELWDKGPSTWIRRYAQQHF